MSSATRFIASITRFSSTYHCLTRSLGDQYLSNYTRSHHYYNTHVRNFSAYSSVQPGPQLPPQPPSSSLSWLLGIALTIILPFAGNKYGPLLQFKKDVDTTVETIEEIVEVIEKVAEVVDKVAEGISGDLPVGGKLKKLVDIVENVAEETDADAHIVGDAIDKFQDLEGKVEKIVGSLNDEGNKHRKDDDAKDEK